MKTSSILLNEVEKSGRQLEKISINFSMSRNLCRGRGKGFVIIEHGWYSDKADTAAIWVKHVFQLATDSRDSFLWVRSGNVASVATGPPIRNSGFSSKGLAAWRTLSRR